MGAAAMLVSRRPACLGRVMARMGVFATAPWLRAPLLLLRQPGLLLAIAAGAFVAVLPAASAPLFLSSARSAALHHQLDNTCPAKVALHVESTWAFRGPGNTAARSWDPSTGRARYAERRATVTREAAATPGVTGPTTTLRSATVVRGATVGGVSTDLGGARFWLVGRSGDFGAHLRVRQGPDGRGLWLPESFAAEHGLAVGDTIETATLRLAPGRFPPPVDPAAPRLPLRVAAVYADPGAAAIEPYWCTVQALYGFRANSPDFDTELMPVVFTDLDIMVDVGVGSTTNLATEYTDIELVNQRPDTPGAHAMAARVADLRRRVEPSYPFEVGPFRPSYISSLDHDTRRAELVHGTLRGTVVPAAGAGVLIGLVVVAAAAAYWIQRRQRELAVLAAHGVPPAALAVKAAIEALGGLAVGAAAGFAVAWALVVAAGPSPVLSAEALPWAVAVAAGCWLGCLAATGVAVGLRLRRTIDAVPVKHRTRLRHLPFELLLFGLAAALWWLIGDRNEHVDAAAAGVGAVAHVPVRLIVVPVVAFVAAVILAARLGARWITHRRRGRGGHPRQRPAVFLALRRIARPVAAAVILAAATAVPVALAGYSAAVTGSLRLTLDAKAAMILGSDTVATLSRPVEVPAAVADRATLVLRLDRVPVGDLQVDVIGVDPDTFGRGAFWHPQIPGPGVARRVADLHAGPAPNGVGSAALRSGRQQIRLFGEPAITVDVGTGGLLPGVQGGYPVLLIHRDALGRLAPYATPQLWVRGDPDGTVAALDRAGVPVTRIARTSGSYGDSQYEPITYTFQYLIALDVFAGLVVVAGLLLYVEARTPQYQRGYVLLRRLGFRRRSHLAALFLETALPMAAGLAIGLILAAVATWTGRGDLDLAATSPPGPLIAVPTGVLAAVFAAAVGISLVSCAFAQFRVVRADPAEVLRT
jgi:putative ABC transport system permease protein